MEKERAQLDKERETWEQSERERALERERERAERDREREGWKVQEAERERESAVLREKQRELERVIAIERAQLERVREASNESNDAKTRGEQVFLCALVAYGLMH